MNHLFFTRNITIQNNSNSFTQTSKQVILPHPLNNEEILNSSSNFTFANNPLNTSNSSLKEYKKFGFSHIKKSSSKIVQDLPKFSLKVQLQNEKLDIKAKQPEKDKILTKNDRSDVQQQFSERAHTSKSQSRIENENSTQKQRPSLSKSKLKRLSFVKKKSYQTNSNCFSQKLSNQHQSNHQLPEQITTKKKMRRKLSINTMTDTFVGQNTKNPKQELQLKKITQHSIQATPSNKMSKLKICVSCGNFLINISKIFEKELSNHKKIKELFKDLKYENKKITLELIALKNSIKRQVQNIGLHFISLIKKTFPDEGKKIYYNKIKTQQNTRNSIKNKECLKLNRSEIFSSTDQEAFTCFSSRERLDTKLEERIGQRSVSSSNSIGKIIKNYGSRKESWKKNSRKLELQMIIHKYEGKFKKNRNQTSNYGKIVSTGRKNKEKEEKYYDSPLTERLIKYQSEFQQQKAVSKSVIQRQQSYRQCYNNIKEALSKLKQDCF